MASIDERIVSMTFDNAKFEAALAKTMASLQKLDASLAKIGSTSGLNDLSKAASKVDFSPINKSVDQVNSKLGSISIDSLKSKFSSATSTISGAIDSVQSKVSTIGSGASKAFGLLSRAAGFVNFGGVSKQAEDVDAKLSQMGANKAFTSLETSSDRVQFAGVTKGLDALTGKFSNLSVVATASLATIASKATSTGLNIVKSFTVQPLIDGFQGYETQINAIQTILANTGLKGSKGIAEVNSALADLQEYANKTVYNFADMAKNIGTFTAAGVKLKPATESIKGIANLAALSGSNSQQASTAMYQLSQAIAAGRVGLQDYNSVVNAGIGGHVFQKAIVDTAVAMGTLNKNAVKVNKATGQLTINGESFRNSISSKPGKPTFFTSDVLTKTLAQFTGDLTVAQLKAQGFTAQQAKDIVALGKTASSAATNIKTFSQLTQALKEEVATAFGTVFKTIFGDLAHATTLFSGIHTVVENGLTKPIYSLNKLLEATAKLGGRVKFLDGLKNVFNAISTAIRPVKEAFRDIFPATTPRGLLGLITSFDNFSKKLKIGANTLENIRRTFRGVFAVLDIGKQVVSGVFSALVSLFGEAGKGSGGFLKFTGSVGDALVNLDKFLKKGDKVKTFFTSVGSLLSVPIHLIGVLGDAIGNLFGGKAVTNNLSKNLDSVNSKLSPLSSGINAVKKIFGAFGNVISGIGDKLSGIGDDIAKVFGSFGNIAANAITKGDYTALFAAVNTTLVGGIFLTLRKALGGGGPKIEIGGGLGKNLSGTFDNLNKSIVTLQQNVKANTLVKIATAIALLSGSLLVLSKIKPAQLTSSLTAMAVGIKILLGSLTQLKGIGFGGAGAATGVLILAAAMDTLSIALTVISKLNPKELATGLAGVLGSLKAIAIGTKGMDKSLIAVGVALLPISAALNLIALSMKIFATLDPASLAKGIGGILGALSAINIGTRGIGPQLIIVGPALAVVAGALLILAGAVKLFGSMDLKTIGTGLVGIAGSLIVIGLAVRTIPPTLALQAAGLVILSVALTGIAGALKLFASMSIEKTAQGIGAIGASLLVLAGGLYLMDGTLPGAAALLVAASALTLLVPVIGLLGSLKFSTVAKGLGAIAATMVVIGVSGLIAAPALLALGLGLTGLGVGLLAAGVGIKLIATGLSILGSTGQKGVAVMVVALTGLIAVIPNLVISFAKGVVQIIAEIAKLAPTVAVALVKIINTLLDVVVKSSPKLAVAAIALIGAFLKVIDDKADNIIATGIKLILNLLQGIRDNIVQVTTLAGEIVTGFLSALALQLPQMLAAGVSIVVNFLNGIAANIGRIVAAGATMVANFLAGIASALPRVLPQATKVIVNFLTGLANDMPKLTAAGATLIASFINGIANNIQKIIDAGANLVVKVLEGIGSKADKVASAAAKLVGDFISACADAVLTFVNRIGHVILNFLVGIRLAIIKYETPIFDAGVDIAIAIVDGIVQGLEDGVARVAKAAEHLALSIPGKLLSVLHIKSPSRVMIGIAGHITDGLVVGLNEGSADVQNAASRVGDNVIKSTKMALAQMPTDFGIKNINPVISPVLDLSAVHKEAKNMPVFDSPVAVTASSSFNQANAISTEKAAADAFKVAAAQVADIPSVKFEQNNYSPESLSTAEIYRRTNNQVSKLKEAIGAK